MAFLIIPTSKFNGTYSCGFLYKNEHIIIEISDNGHSLKLYKNGYLISDFFGDCHSWKYAGNLHGAALKQFTIGEMRSKAIYILENEDFTS